MPQKGASIARRPSRHTQWAAQFAVASELAKRGYEVAFTLGNHPEKDLLVMSPNKVEFAIDVKGLDKKSFWLLKKRPITKNLFYVFAFVPTGAPNVFCIFSHDEVNEGISTDVAGWKKRRAAKNQVANEKGYLHGVAWKYAEQFKDAWYKLPQ
jgi:hypothetical protein